MFKRSITIGLFSFICLAAFACEDDNDKHSTSGCNLLKCEQYIGGKNQICAVISGKGRCESACLGNAEGANQPVCYSNGSLPPDSRPVFSTVDTCAKDDNGKLYSVSVDEEQCQYGCDDATGLCNKDNPGKKCSLSCLNDGGEAQVCVKLSGTESCKAVCRGYKEGANAAGCYENESLPPEARDQYSVVTVCAKDDLGTLYATDKQETKCEYGCDKTSGECNKEPETTCEELNCEGAAGDGISHFCATIDGKAVCKNVCLGTLEGENPAVCFSNGSLPPDSRKFYRFVDTCEKDDNGQLYSVSPQKTECPNGCYDDGECK